MELDIRRLTKARLPLAQLRHAMDRTIRRYGQKKSFESLSLVVTTDTHIQKLNRQYRNKNKPTDVLSFDYGEIVISYPTAKRQAKQHGLTSYQEVVLLFVHGLLHILGHDHEKKNARHKMQEAETWLLGYSGLVDRASEVKRNEMKRIKKS